MSIKTVIINDTSKESHLGSELVIDTIRKYCLLNSMEVIGSFTRVQSQNPNAKVLSKINKCDLIIINGEGSLHDNSQFFQGFMNKLPKNKKIVLINTVWQNMKYYNVKQHLERLDFISVRESLSYKEIIKLVDPKKVIITPDLILDKKFFKFNIGFSDSVIESVRKNMKEKGNYFPLSFIEKGSYQEPIIVAKPSVEAYLYWLHSVGIHVTGRFHGVCLSLIAGTPFLAIPSNTHKIEGILKDMKCEELIINNLDEMVAKLPLSLQYDKQKTQYLEQARVKIPELFRRIAKL